MACEMNIEFKKKTKKDEKKEVIAANLKLNVTKLVGGKAGFENKNDHSSLNEDTEVTISYKGNNKKVFLTGIDIASLNTAIIEFPQTCNGNIDKYILWPYEKC